MCFYKNEGNQQLEEREGKETIRELAKNAIDLFENQME